MLNNSQARPPSEFIGAENSFIFETLNENSNKYNCIYANTPLLYFDDLAKLDQFIASNPSIIQVKDAGVAGYISYEGEAAFALYENIWCGSSPINISDKKSETKYKLIKPNNENFIRSVDKCKDYIKEGDIYQANLSQKFIIQASKSSQGLELYQKLKSINPAPYAGYMNFKHYEIASSSPESFIRIEKTGNRSWKISSSPIKGTAQLDKLNELISSSKEKAEHIMIVDLIRNDLGKICLTGTVEVKEFLAVHKFKNLYHLVSTVGGLLSNDCINEQLGVPLFAKIFQACFPGGSITGAPKKRAMEIIKELEGSPRGPYTGTMGYYKFNGEGEFNILIRTIVIDKKTSEISFHSGAGITAESIPKNELEEIYLKAEKLAEIFEIRLNEY